MPTIRPIRQRFTPKGQSPVRFSRQIEYAGRVPLILMGGRALDRLDRVHVGLVVPSGFEQAMVAR